MNIEAVVEVADHLFLEHRDKPLSELQKEILKGTLENCEYDTIAERTKYSPDYVKVVGAKLWSELSDILGTEIRKHNFKLIVENINIDNNFDSPTVQGFDTAFQGDVNINICSNARDRETSISEKSDIAVENAPEYFNCYGREKELNLLQNWILEERDRLITILGFPGIGKTTLSLKLAEQVQPQFDAVVYRSLRFPHSLSELLLDLLDCFAYKKNAPYSITKKISIVTNILKKRKYLLILDDFHHLFASGELAGTYQKKFEQYRLFFETIASHSHQSCLLLCGREKPEEIAQWEKGKNSVRSLELKGSQEVAIALFQDQKLKDEKSWQTLIKNWQGHPLQLQEMAILIQDIFAGDTTQFVEHSTNFLGNNLKGKIKEHLDRLSEFEKDIILAFNGEERILPIAKLISKSRLLPSEFFSVVQSLQRRFYLETQPEEGKKCFALSPLLHYYLISNPLD